MGVFLTYGVPVRVCGALSDSRERLDHVHRHKITVFNQRKNRKSILKFDIVRLDQVQMAEQMNLQDALQKLRQMNGIVATEAARGEDLER